MRIIILAVRDTGGTSYTLAHAINKITPEHQAVNVRGQNNFINYPTIAEMGNYNRSGIRKMIYAADVVVFLGAMKPFFDALKLRKKQLQDKKKILLCMGSEWRLGRKLLLKQADKQLRNYQVVLGGADLFIPYNETDEPVGDDMAYLPVVRSFDEIRGRFQICSQDQNALESFTVPPRKVTFIHAPTSERNKGSEIFYKAATRAMQACPKMAFKTVFQRSWFTTLQSLATSHVLFDQAPPFPTAYGALSVEAAIFKLPTFSQIDPRCRQFIKRETGLDTPHLTFEDDEDLLKKTVALALDPKLREMFGNMNYDYCRKVHDEQPVVERFLKIVDEM
jgi:hypothetical protein